MAALFPVSAGRRWFWTSLGGGRGAHWEQLPTTSKFDSRTYVYSGILSTNDGTLSLCWLGPFIQLVPDETAVNLVGINGLIRNGTSATIDIVQNPSYASSHTTGTGISGLTGLTVTTTKQSTMWKPSASIPVNDQDAFAPYITAISGTPDGLALTFFFEYVLL